MVKRQSPAKPSEHVRESWVSDELRARSLCRESVRQGDRESILKLTTLDYCLTVPR